MKINVNWHTTTKANATTQSNGYIYTSLRRNKNHTNVFKKSSTQFGQKIYVTLELGISIVPIR